MAPASRARFSRPIFAPNSRALSRPGRKGRLRPAAAFRALPRPGDSAPGPSGPGPRSQTRIRRGPGRYRSPPRAALGDPGRRGGDRRAGARRPQRRRRVGGGTRCRVTAEPTEGRLHSESESLPGRASRPRSHASWWLVRVRFQVRLRLRPAIPGPPPASRAAPLAVPRPGSPRARDLPVRAAVQGWHRRSGGYELTTKGQAESIFARCGSGKSPASHRQISGE